MNSDIEIKLLKETILAMRAELERAQFEERANIQQALANAQAEIRQLQTSIIELRDQLELRQVQHEQKLQSVGLDSEHEKAELRRTISTLREKLEELNESRNPIRGSQKAAQAASPSH